MMRSNLVVKIMGLWGCLLIVACGPKKDSCQVPEVPTYTNDVASIIEVKCFRCHSKEDYKTKASRTKIYDYENLKKMGESGLLVGTITHAAGFIPMPFRSGEKIDDCSIAIISKWVATGMNK